MDPYVTLGATYALTRRPDPRIAAQIGAAIVGTTVVNVGAGTGAYEPADKLVTAVEPSATMLAQRPPGSAPAVQSSAECLPFGDLHFDTAMAVLTIHHWTDWRRGLAEMCRVARRQIVLTWDVEVMAKMWLISEYVPEVARIERGLATLPEAVEGLARPGTTVRTAVVPVPADCTDGFLAAFWRRPERYLDDEVWDGASGLAKLPRAVRERAMTQLAADLSSGRWHERHDDLLQKTEFDAGYRLVVAP